MRTFFALIIILSFFLGTTSPAMAANLFAPTTSIEQLKSIYLDARQGGKKLKILIVPGHDREYWGTEYLGTKEASLNYQMAEILRSELSAQKEFDVLMARDANDYAPAIAAYFKNQREEITRFRNERRATMGALKGAGEVAERDNVYHNNANEEVATRLYGLNKWANENSIDFVIHIHMNDTPERRKRSPGPYNGFVVYVPDNQFSNSIPGLRVGQSIFKQMQKYFAVSNMPNEAGGVIEDQKLIALGAMNSLSPGAILIEYGYIYEPQIIKPEIRQLFFKEVSRQTTIGITNFLNDMAEEETATIPNHRWANNFKKGAKNSKDVFALQMALTLDGYYPPKGKTKNDCPATGNYGNCTVLALAQFQKDFGIKSTGVSVGPFTRAKLNELYYNKN